MGPSMMQPVISAAKLAKETGDALAHRQDGQRERKAELEAQQAQH